MLSLLVIVAVNSSLISLIKPEMKTSTIVERYPL